MIVARFKDWRSLLFISLVVATSGVLPYFLGFLLEYFKGAPYWLSMTLSTVGWICLVTGQSFVLEIKTVGLSSQEQPPPTDDDGDAGAVHPSLKTQPHLDWVHSGPGSARRPGDTALIC